MKLGGNADIITVVLAMFSIMVLSVSTAGAAAKEADEVKQLKKVMAIIETKFGEIEIKFFPDVAAGHVKNFIKLAKGGFYDGTIFHRVIPGFMIQGGDPNTKGPDRATWGTGGPGYTVAAEFNQLPHKRGILSMARRSEPDSAGSQFFIVVKDTPSLDGKYTVFGEVTKGMDVVDKIVELPTDPRDVPEERVEIKVRVVE